MKNYKLFSIILVLGLLLFALACSDSITEATGEPEEATTQKTYTPTMDDIDQIARSLSILLKNKEYRELIENEIKSSTYVENILEVSTFLNSKEMFLNSENTFFKSRAKKGSTILSEIVETLPPNATVVFERNIKALKFGLIDIYFPIVEHRNTWNSEKELIVAPLNSKIIKENDSYSGYLIGGEKTKFSREPDPDKHVLVVCPSEKSGDYTNSFSASTLMKNSMIYTSWYEGQKIYYPYKTILKKYMIGQIYDPMDLFEGESEIYLKYRKKRFGSSYWGSWKRYNLSYHVKPYIWYNVNFTLIADSKPYSYVVQMWDEDDWFYGSDDLIAGTTWDYSYLGNDVNNVTTLEAPMFSICDWIINKYRRLVEDDPAPANGCGWCPRNPTTEIILVHKKFN